MRGACAGTGSLTAGCSPGHGPLPLLQFGELQALAELYSLAGQPRAAHAARSRASALQARTLQLLWNPDLQFLGVLALDAPPWAPIGWCDGTQPVYPGGTVAPVRELLGLAAPYYFRLVPQAAVDASDTADVARFHAMWDQVRGAGPGWCGVAQLQAWQRCQPGQAADTGSWEQPTSTCSNALHVHALLHACRCPPPPTTVGPMSPGRC